MKIEDFLNRWPYVKILDMGTKDWDFKTETIFVVTPFYKKKNSIHWQFIIGKFWQRPKIYSLQCDKVIFTIGIFCKFNVIKYPFVGQI